MIPRPQPQPELPTEFYALIKGGTGIAYLYGGDGTDTLYYNPTNDNIANFGQYLSPSILDGDAGTDTLHIYNEAKYTQDSVVKAAATEISMDGNVGRITFENPVTGTSSGAGQFQDMEKVTVTGIGRLEFIGSSFSGPGIDITGTAGADVFTSRSASDTLRGDAGNDTINGQGGNDTIDGGIGDDRLFGGTGADYMDGGAGHDWLDAGDAWQPYISDALNLDSLRGGDGNDHLVGGDFDDLSGGDGNDHLYLRAGAVYFDANEGYEWEPELPTADVSGGAGYDTAHIEVGDGATTMDYPVAVVNVYAHGGGDFYVSFAEEGRLDSPAADLDGIEAVVLERDGPALNYFGQQQPATAGSVSITGTVGDDDFFSGIDVETVDLGAGNDLVEMNRSGDRVTTGTGNDTVTLGGRVSGIVTDFDPAHDTLRFRDVPAEEVGLREDAAGTWVEAPDGMQVLLAGLRGFDGFDFV